MPEIALHTELKPGSETDYGIPLLWSLSGQLARKAG